MPPQIVIYSKQSGEPRIPLTVRLDWYPDGAIRPRMYWTPDGTCHKIISLFENVPLAYLKDRGEGLRFKMTGEVIETPLPDDGLLHTRYETYLYLADNRFSQKNIIDERYGHSNKEYVLVTMDIFPDGDYELVYFKCRGARYKVENTLDVEPRGSFRAGGAGLWHKVEARLINEDDDEDPDPTKSIRRLGALYLEFNKWFVYVTTQDPVVVY